MLKTMLNQKMAKEGLSSRDVAKLTGVSHTTIIRASNGDVVDLETILALGKWMGVRPSTLLNSYSTDDFEATVTALLEAIPGLKPVIEQAMEAVRSGAASPTIIADIVAYANYKLGEVNVDRNADARTKRARMPVIGKG
jgi:transcriptional regulator with XRE-family HTH domain